MNCPTCGDEVHGRFCTNCGTRMDALPAAAPEFQSTSTAAFMPEDLQQIMSAEPQAADPASEAAPNAVAGSTTRFNPGDLQKLVPAEPAPSASPPADVGASTQIQAGDMPPTTAPPPVPAASELAPGLSGGAGSAVGEPEVSDASVSEPLNWWQRLWRKLWPGRAAR